MRLDELSGMIGESIIQLKQSRFQDVLETLLRIDGVIRNLTSIELMWDFIREEYEDGDKPGEIAKRYQNVTPKQIRDRAYNHGWVTERKIKLHLAKKMTTNNTFKGLIDCYQCQQKFSATSGNAKLCGQCSAKKQIEEYQKKQEKILQLAKCLQCKETFKPIDESVKVCDKCHALYHIESERKA